MIKSRKIYRNNIDSLKNPAIKRIGESIGIKNMSGLTYETIRGKVKNYMEEVIKKAVTYGEYYKKKTINKGMIYLAINKEKWSENLPAKGCAFPKYKKNTAEKRINWYKRQQGKNKCLHFPVEPFSRLVREVTQDYSTGLRFTKEAFIYLQYIVESYVAELLSNALLNAKRSTSKINPVVMPKHLY